MTPLTSYTPTTAGSACTSTRSWRSVIQQRVSPAFLPLRARADELHPVFDMVQDSALKSKRIFLYSSDEPDKKANAALLMALYAVSWTRSTTWSSAGM